MSDFFHVITVMFVCITVIGLAMLVLLAMPKSKLRSYLLEMTKYLVSLLLVLLVISPVDVIPDVIPALGFGDDIAYIIAAIASFNSARGEKEDRKRLQ